MCPKDHAPAGQKTRFEPQVPNKRQKTTTDAGERRQPMQDSTNTATCTPALSDVQLLCPATHEIASQSLVEDADATIEGSTFEELSMEPDLPQLVLTLDSDDEPDPFLDVPIGSEKCPLDTCAPAHASSSCLTLKSWCQQGRPVSQSDRACKTLLHPSQAPQLFACGAGEQKVSPVPPTLATPSATKDLVLAKSRVASFYGKKMPAIKAPAIKKPAIKAPSCQPLGFALPRVSALGNISFMLRANKQHGTQISQAMVATAGGLPKSAHSTDQFMADFMSHLAGLPPATEDVAVEPLQAQAAKAEAKRNAQDAAAFEALDDGKPSDGKVRGRKKQFSLLSSTLQHLVEQGTAGSVVLCGPPGGGKTLTTLAVLHMLGNLSDAESFSKRRPAFIHLPCTDTAASAWCPRILHAIKTFPKDQGQQVYRPEYRDPKKKIDRARNHAKLQEEVTKAWAPEEDSGPAMFVIILNCVEKVSTRLDDAKKQIQDLLAITQVEASRLILVVITSCGEPDLHKLGLDEHDILRFPAYTAKEIKNVFRRRMRKLEGVQEKVLQGRISVAFGICKNALRMERQARQNVTAEPAVVLEARGGQSRASRDGVQDLGSGTLEHSYMIGLPMMRKAVLEATPAQTVEEMTTDFQMRLLAKQRRIAAEDSLGDTKDPVKMRAVKEEVLSPAPQSSGFNIEALPGDAKRKVQCIKRLPRDSMAVLCGAIVLMRVDLRLQDAETIMIPVPDDQQEGQEGWRWKRVASKNGCMIPQDPDAPPRKDALHSYCRLDTLEKMCCSTFQKELLGNLYGDRFSTAWNNLVTHGIMRKSISRINGNPQRLQLLWQEWHFRAAFEGHRLMQRLYNVYTRWMDPK
ncbi:hypothetical protein WJX77_009822 [Trebouxia sp. C0004]